MLQPVLDLLRVRPGSVVVDGTVGHGGHAEGMLAAAGDEGVLVAADWDEAMLRKAEENLKGTPGRKRFVHADFRDLPAWLHEHEAGGADAILLDFGVNLQHFQDPLRGFSFLTDAPLDMRMDRSSRETAAAWLGRATHGEIAAALRDYGGERWAGPIAREIVARRKRGGMKRTTDLVEAVLAAVPPQRRDKRIDPATRTFQAVRIAVNRELEGLEDAIRELAACLRPGGRMATLSYHSGEDRAAKNAFKSLARSAEFRIVTKRPLTPTAEETRENPRSRSAKLRAIERTNKETDE